MTDDLRQRIAAAIRTDDRIDDNDYHPQQPTEAVFGRVDDFADVALSVFAAWLRERADRADEGIAQARGIAAETPGDPLIPFAGVALQGAAGALRKAADEIAPTSSTEQEA